jgi:hypothetical protein
MVKTTRAQRVALKKIYMRDTDHPLYKKWIGGCSKCGAGADLNTHYMTYREFRETITPYPGGDCIMVPWYSMWLGIEKDGYVHS